MKAKRALLLLTLAACSHAPPPRPPPRAAPVAAPETPGICRVVGAGELAADEPPEAPTFKTFSIFADAKSVTPVLIVNAPGAVRVTWEIGLAPPTNGAPRARVELGGQSMVRYRGYASGLERGFQLRQRLTLGPGVWLRAGKEVDVLHAWKSGSVRVRARSGELHLYPDVPCADLVYQPSRLNASDGPKETAEVVGPVGFLTLLDGPAEPGPLPAFTVPGLERAWVLERRSGFTRISGEQRRLVVEGWVRDEELARRPMKRRGDADPMPAVPERGPGFAARVKRDTALFLDQDRVDGALVEEGAKVIVHEERGGRAAFSFAEGDTVPVIGAPEGRTFWIASDALARQ